jgi:multidrug efflux pump subunit AcrA (membrane-fusion protein)
MITVAELLSRAKHAIKSGEASLHAAAEDIAAAQAQGATQRQIAEAVGKSAAWVNRLLGWRESGYRDDTPFGSQAKAARQRAQRVHSREQKEQKPATSSEQAQADAARARAETAKAEAAKAKAEAERAKAEAAKAKAEARTARAKAKANQHSFFSFGGNKEKKSIHSGQRELLIKFLGMLGSDHAGERDNAARFVEKQRKQLGMTWDELIVPADEAQARAA